MYHLSAYPVSKRVDLAIGCQQYGMVAASCHKDDSCLHRDLHRAAPVREWDHTGGHLKQVVLQNMYLTTGISMGQKKDIWLFGKNNMKIFNPIYFHLNYCSNGYKEFTNMPILQI